MSAASSADYLRSAKRRPVMTEDAAQHQQDLVATADHVPCYAEVPHDGHLWTFADDYPLMLCEGVTREEFNRRFYGA